jgi:glycosyltransferase involved in cell wall biosynthesis
MKKVIFVNATSATKGGSLTILKQFIDNIEIKEEIKKIYYVFVPINTKLTSFESVNIIPIKAKGYIERIKWDLNGMMDWSKKNVIFPDLIISLQNTGVRFGKVPQLIYLHQPIPYSNESSWDLFKKDERKLWFYKYIYKLWIDFTVRKEHYIVVQTNWMKEALIENGYSEQKILISHPNIKEINIDLISKFKKNNGVSTFFYPAADYKYKNHIVIIEAIKEIKNLYPNIIKKIKVIFTLDQQSPIYNRVVNAGILETVEFIGHIEYDEALKHYKSSDVILFPSYIETFGLPLIEASSFGKKIIVADCNYSKEVIGDYPLATFVDHRDKNIWAKVIIDSIKPYIEKPKLSDNKNGWKKVFNLIEQLI